MLKQAAPDRDPASFYRDGRPSKIQFGNHASAHKHADFITKEVEKCAAAGMIVPWMGTARPRRVSVHLEAGGANSALTPTRCMLTPTLSTDPSKYERIVEMAHTHTTGPGDFPYTKDDKSGYWQVSTHESTHAYLRMEWGGNVWFWPHLPLDCCRHADCTC